MSPAGALPSSSLQPSDGRQQVTKDKGCPEALLLTSQVTLPRYHGPSHAEPLPSILRALCQGERERALPSTPHRLTNLRGAQRYLLWMD